MKQTHIGKLPTNQKGIFHSHCDNPSAYWSGWLPSDISVEDLLYLGVSIINDIIDLYPEVANDAGFVERLDITIKSKDTCA